MKLVLTSVIALGLLIGCGARHAAPLPIIEKKPQAQLESVQDTHTVRQSKLPPAPKKKVKLKTVEDTNYSDKYMYPEDSKAAKKDPVKKEARNTASHGMTKAECINMISQEKFDRYTAMFGDEAASIKRCAMLKAMKK